MTCGDCNEDANRRALGGNRDEAFDHRIGKSQRLMYKVQQLRGAVYRPGTSPFRGSREVPQHYD